MVKTSCNNYQRSGLRCLTSRTSRRLRRMRVYNPLASFEQAVQISQLFEKPEELRTDDYKGIEEDEAQAYNIVDLPDDVLVIIFNYVITPEYFMKHPLLESYKFGSSSRLACKEFYKLSSVCKRFRDFVHKYHSMFPQPTIGLTLQTPFGCSPNYGGCVVAYIYGDCGKQWPTKCVFIDEVPAAIFPGRISTFLVIKGMMITDYLMDMLLNLDLSKVEELFWHDIRGSYASNLIEKMETLLTNMPELCYAEFYSSNNFDPTTMFPDSNCYWMNLGLEKEDQYGLSPGYMRKIYDRIRNWRLVRRKKRGENCHPLKIIAALA